MRTLLFPVFSILCGVLVFGSCKSNDITASTTTIGQQCNMGAASDAGGSGGCGAGTVCTVNYCRTACTTDANCSAVAGSICLSGAGGEGCRLPEEAKCSAASPCKAPGLVCGSDNSCRNFCNDTNAPCLVTGDLCVQGVCVGGPASPGDGGGAQDATTVAQEGGGAQDSAMSSQDSAVAPSSDGGTACPSAQTQFGNTAQGDTNMLFRSGVGTRTANNLFIFSGYTGPDPDGDGGGPVNVMYVQAFDPVTGSSKGPAQKSFLTPNLNTPADYNGTQLLVAAAAVAPTGQIALVYDAEFSGTKSFYAAFLDSSVDAGAPAGIELRKIVLVSSTEPRADPPRLIWSNASNAFVILWNDTNNGAFVRVQKFLADGRSAGGNTDVVPTNNQAGTLTNISCGVGESGNLFGVSYLSDLPDRKPWLTVLDTVGNQVGGTIPVGPSSPTGPTQGWATNVAGTAKGFVYFYDTVAPPGVAEVFLPTSGDAGVVGVGSDGGNAGGFPTFNFTGAIAAFFVNAVSDGPGGLGGVGVALAYPNSVSFAYVNQDGIGHQQPNSVFGHHSNGSPDVISLSNFNGSFVLSLYDASNHSTQVAASGCH